MSDVPNPASPQPPAYEAPAPAGYPAAPPPAYGAPAPGARPGRTLGIVALIVSFFAALIGLILGIVALVQSKKAGQGNGFAVAAIVISSVLIVVGIIVTILLITYASGLANEILQVCGSDPSGSVNLWGQSVPCSEIQTTAP